MVKRFKCTAKKLSSGQDFSPCWYCGKQTLFALTEKDGSEIWCCKKYLWEIEKIKRFKPRVRKCLTLQEKTISEENLHINKIKNVHIAEVRDGK